MNVYPNKDEMSPEMALQLFNTGAFFVHFFQINFNLLNKFFRFC